VPVLKNIGKSAAYTGSNSAMAHATIFTDNLSKGYVHSLPISTAWPEFSIPWNTVIAEQIWNGTKTAAQALPGLNATINQNIKKFG